MKQNISSENKLRLLIRQILKEEFYMAEHFDLKEGNDVATIDMLEEAKMHIDETINALSVASSELYEIKKMADYIHGDFPELSEELLTEIEPLMEKFERFYPMKLKGILSKFR